MIENKLAEDSYSQLIAPEKTQIVFLHGAIEKTQRQIARFSFIDLSQWMLLAFLNCVCLGFVFLSCSLID